MKKLIKKTIGKSKILLNKFKIYLINEFIHIKENVEEKNQLFQQKKDARKVILFNNSPITNTKDDAFDFKTKACAIKEAIDNKANIIALIGEYGVGKSSLTKLLYKKYLFSFRKPIFINLWDCVVENERKEDEPTYFTKSFLYQLASKNKKKSSFARYINQRLSNSYGKISFSISTKWSVFFLFLSLFFLILFFCLKNDNCSITLFSNIPIPENYAISEKFIGIINKIISNINKIIGIINIAPYLLFIPISIFAFLGLMNNNVLFSLWDSQGKIKPSDTDYFEIFKEITNHLRPKIPALKRKRLVIIEDLDRSENSKIVKLLLKELYRFVTLMDKKELKQFVFIVSLKSEASLCKDDEKEGLSLYSKIFDYTVWIRPLHFNNVQEIVKPLLNNKLGKKKANKIISDLDWIMKGEKLTVREIKDRLNETFLLHQSLVNRDDSSCLVSYRKCAAVVYLQRQFPKYYQVIIDNEEGFKKLITESYYLGKKIDEDYLKKNFIKEESKAANDIKKAKDFIKDFLLMLNTNVIENDYLMYFYNYPKSSYIMNYAEKTVYDYLIHDNYTFDNDSVINSLLSKIINDNKALIIQKAFKELKENNKNLGQIVFYFEQLFLYTYKNNKKELINSYKILFLKTLDVATSLKCFENILNFNISEDILKEIIDISIPIIIETNKANPIGIQNIRSTLFKKHPEKIHLFYALCVSNDEQLPIIITEVIEKINNTEDLFKCLDFTQIQQNQISTYLRDILKFDFSDKENSERLIKKLKEIPNISSTENIHETLIILLKKNSIFDEELFNILYKNFNTENDKDLIDYIQCIDYLKLSDDTLKKIDDLTTNEISDITLIELLESKNNFKSSIFSRLKLDDFKTFNFDNEWLAENIVELASLINQDEPELFQKLRIILIGKHKVSKVYDLFNEPFDFVSKNELDILTPEDIYYAIDFSRIDDEKIEMIANHCNNKEYTSKNLYKFFKALLFGDDRGNRIAEKNNIETLFNLIDFNICKFDSLANNQQEEILKNISPIIELDNCENAINFIKKIKCHATSLTLQIHADLEEDASLFDEYIDVCNNISKTTDEVITFISEHEINCALSKEITDKLFKIKNYENYILGKSLNDNAYFFNESIPLIHYYNVYCKNDSYYELVKDTDLINKFYDNNIYEKSIFDIEQNEMELDKKRLQPFMQFSQTIKLFELILSKLETNEERKIFIKNIPEFHSYKESELAIDIVLKEPYLQMFSDDEDFTDLFKEKLWDNDDKGQPKKGILKSKFTREYKKVMHK